MEQFPQDIKTLIFLFDPTKRERLDKLLHQMKFVLPLFQIKKMCEIRGEENWRSFYLDMVRKTRSQWKTFYQNHPDIVETYRYLKWRLFLEDHLNHVE